MQSEIQIEKNIPIPPMLRGKAGEMAITLQAMEVGDSFTYHDDPNKSQRLRIGYVAKRLGMAMTIRLIGDGQYRAWRVK